MYNRTGVKKETFGSPTQILYNVQYQMGVSVKVDAAAGTADGSKTIVKAGTPLAGDLTNRTTAFTAATGADAVGVLLHDVDVTDGAANGSLLIWGFVNLDRLDTATAGKVTDAVKSALDGKVWFLRDN